DRLSERSQNRPDPTKMSGPWRPAHRRAGRRGKPRHDRRPARRGGEPM
ncbi:MAG: hypothetical protein AVDCRST_MAG59-1534, partial [uncultured Thermomicrobiales bacterium]